MRTAIPPQGTFPEPLAFAPFEDLTPNGSPVYNGGMATSPQYSPASPLYRYPFIHALLFVAALLYVGGISQKLPSSPLNL
jgi:hypothetical protein